MSRSIYWGVHMLLLGNCKDSASICLPKGGKSQASTFIVLITRAAAKVLSCRREYMASQFHSLYEVCTSMEPADRRYRAHVVLSLYDMIRLFDTMSTLRRFGARRHLAQRVSTSLAISVRVFIAAGTKRGTCTDVI